MAREVIILTGDEADYLAALIEVDDMGANAPEGVDAKDLHERLVRIVKAAKGGKA